MSDQPKPKPYSFTEEGGILFRSTRTVWDVRIPSWVYDLWMPLLGAEAMGIYALYCRLEMHGAVRKISLRDLARIFRIGDKRLSDINDLLEDCGFITINKPEGLRRLKHWTTEIIVNDPSPHIPATVIEKYKHPKGYQPVTTWLVGDGRQSPETLGSVSTTHQVVSPNTPSSVPMIEDLDHVEDLDQDQTMHGAKTTAKPKKDTRTGKKADGCMDDLLQNPNFRFLRKCGVMSDRVAEELMVLPLSTLEYQWALVKDSTSIKDKPGMLVTNLRKILLLEAAERAAAERAAQEPVAPKPIILCPEAEKCERPEWITLEEWARWHIAPNIYGYLHQATLTPDGRIECITEELTADFYDRFGWTAPYFQAFCDITGAQYATF